MKKISLVIAFVLAIISMVYFTGSALAGKATCEPLEPGTFVSSVSAGTVTFTFTLDASQNNRMQVDEEGQNFSNPVIDRSVSGSSQNETINLTGNYQWRLLESSEQCGAVLHFAVIQ